MLANRRDSGDLNRQHRSIREFGSKKQPTKAEWRKLIRVQFSFALKRDPDEHEMAMLIALGEKTRKQVSGRHSWYFYVPRGTQIVGAYSTAGAGGLYNAEGLKTTDGEPPAQFWLAGSDHKWHRASATIKGETIELKVDGLTKPVAVRYAFAGFPQVNLVNAAGLPAYPFRNDTWKLK